MGVEDALWLAVFSIAIFVVWLDHLYHAIRRYRHDRTVRSFRNAFIAVMLQVGLARIAVAALFRLYPNDVIGWVAAFLSPILTLLLLSGAIVVFWSWRVER